MHEYLGLDRGRPIFRQDFTCPALLKDLKKSYVYGTITHFGSTFQSILLFFLQATGLVRFRSPLLTESRLMSFPTGT